MRAGSRITSDIFKAYDIRGIYPTEISEDAAWAIGYGFSRFLEKHQAGPVVIGRDMRIGSEDLFAAFAGGVAAGGRKAIGIGMVTTPLVYFAVNTLQAAGGAMITASHNPSDHNGFKLVRERAIPLGRGMGLEDVQLLAAEAPPLSLNGIAGASARFEDMQEAYTQYFAERFPGQLLADVVIDAGNGAVGPVLTPILERLGIRHVPLFFAPDGTFPNHEANPLKEENLRDLRDAICVRKGAIGVAFDGDGDRVAFLDETGEPVGGDLITALLAQDFLKREGPHPILYDLRSSRAVPETIRKAGGTPIRMRVGHAFMKQAMREHNALFGGELSFHYYFRSFFNCESGILAMLEVLRILEGMGQSLREAVAPFGKYAQSGEINFKVKDVGACLDAVKGTFTDGKQDTLDGLSVEYPDWWFNLRPSNTEPLLRMNLEAESAQQLEEKLPLVEQVIASHPEGGPRE